MATINRMSKVESQEGIESYVNVHFLGDFADFR